LRQCSWVRFTRSKATLREITLACVINSILLYTDTGAANAGYGIQLEVSPRVCTLAAGDERCETEVRASWRAAHKESLCLLIVGRPDLKHCWDSATEGSYTVKLAVTDDVTFQLKDLELQHVLASDVLHVIRATTRYRHKRREPWNVFD
jgi:Protein of unknown function (DUF3019)